MLKAAFICPFAGGYSIDDPAQDILDTDARAFIQKPYSLTTLSATIADVLRQACS